MLKTFHEEGLTASVEFEYGVTTPLEVEGLTIDTVQFYLRDKPGPVKLTDVPPRIFSEVMRDMDLVVSVAHRGEVDPEASASTVEMRSSLLRETCQLLGAEKRATQAVARDDQRRVGPVQRSPWERPWFTACRADRCASCRSTPSTAAGSFCPLPTTTPARPR